MAGKGSSAGASTRVAARVLIIEAPYYEDVSKELAAGALAELKARGATFDRIEVPGALEIPQVLTLASAAGLFYGNPLSTKPSARYAGAVALGCVIRGETSHYDIVCNNANHWMMHVATEQHIPVGNGILTVDTHAQALARARGGREGKGGDAARACLRLIELAQSFQKQKT
ncbi:MAG TPA: 6,7-dimethyl-8-ribityllumazine synthase [Hyphomicrobiaceae bacterium]|jgi:6,7-dimethyl-8-ribityllumazine synthase